MNGIEVLGVEHLAQVVDFLNGVPRSRLPQLISRRYSTARPPIRLISARSRGRSTPNGPLRWQLRAGTTSSWWVPPAPGKTMLAKRIASILPPMTFEESLETTKIHSVMGLLDPDQALVTQSPFAAPHHTISDAGLIGGGHVPRPGEVSLPQRRALPGRTDRVQKEHAGGDAPAARGRQGYHLPGGHILTYPARFMLVAAMNPCPCGHAPTHQH